jgi:hypothetical protein
MRGPTVNRLVVKVALIPILFSLLGLHGRTRRRGRTRLEGRSQEGDARQTEDLIEESRVGGAAAPSSTVSQQDSTTTGDSDASDSDTAQTFEEYRDSLPTQTPRGKPGSPEQDYQIKHAGDTEYQISGDGSRVWADGVQGIDTDTGEAIDAKYVGNPGRSPFVPGSQCPDFIREKIDAAQRDEFQRYADVVNSDDNPLTGLQVITNTDGSADYFRGLMQEYDIPGSVSVKD